MKTPHVSPVTSLPEWLERVLPAVQRPSRYIGGEWNAMAWKARAPRWRIGLCVPASYEHGAVRPVVQGIYAALNQWAHLVAERVFLPAPDLEAALRRDRIALFSVESKTPVHAFDLLWCVLAESWEVTGLLRLLQLGEVPLRAWHRDASMPLVLASGQAMTNPEPLAAVVDAVCLGAWLPQLQRLSTLLAEVTPTTVGKTELRQRLGTEGGYYVPSSAIHRPEDPIPDPSPWASLAPVLPFVQTVPDALVVSLNGREPSLDLFTQQLARTGYEDVRLDFAPDPGTLSAEGAATRLTSGGGETLLRWIRTVRRQGVRVSCTALPCRPESLAVLEALGENVEGRERNSGGAVTFWLEGMSQRLRYGMEEADREASDAAIASVIHRAASAGWRSIRLVCAVGFPWEGEEDARSLADVLRWVKRRCQGVQVHVQGQAWIPRAHTPWQWCAQKDEGMWRAHQQQLQRRLPIRWPDERHAVLEGVIARGDRRLGERLVEFVEQHGVGEELTEWLRTEAPTWLRERSLEEPLPWDHLTPPPLRASLAAQYRQALLRLRQIGASGREPGWEGRGQTTGGGQTPNAGDFPRRAVCQNSGSDPSSLGSVCQNSGSDPSSASPRTPPPRVYLQGAVQRVRFRCSRQGWVRFLSHLEQIEVFRRAFRRSGLPLAWSSSRQPQLRLAFGVAISVGYASDAEYLDAWLTRRLDLTACGEQLKAQLPEGFTVQTVKRIPIHFPSVESVVNLAQYHVSGDVPATTWEEAVQRWRTHPITVLEKPKGGGLGVGGGYLERIEVPPLVRQIEAHPWGIELWLRFGPKRHVKPEWIVQRLLPLEENEQSPLRVVRRGLYGERTDGTCFEP